MTRTRLALLLVLLAGNLLLWPARLSEGAAREFDFGRFAERTRELFPESKLAGKRLVDPMLPDTNLYLASTEGPFLTAYVGYYAKQGLLAQEPHRPEVCYRVQGWTLLQAPEPVIVEDGEQSFTIRRTRVAIGAYERIVYFWRQTGAAPENTDASRGWLERCWSGLRAGRSDLAWVRVEVERADEPSLRSNIARMIAATAGCMR